MKKFYKNPGKKDKNMIQDENSLPLEEPGQDNDNDNRKKQEPLGADSDIENSAEEEAEDKAEFEKAESKAEQELSLMKEKYIRLVAEFDNFRKRTARERNELLKTAGEEVIHPLLEVLDDAERAEEQIEKANDIAALKSGVELIFNKLRRVLQSKGLQKMESVGKEFNPESHDAITELEAPEKMKGKVMDEVQAGYLLNDKIIRHAKVVVGK